jgi:EpsI family protein
MSPLSRVVLAGLILAFGLGAEAALESFTTIDRPPLRTSLKTIPLELGDWTGRDEPVHPKIVEQAQTTEYINRVYEWRKRPGWTVGLWINYSREGTNLRHSPVICLPSGGWTKIESLCRVVPITYREGKPLSITRLSYSQGELVQGIGFWYYIFGEGSLERYVRRLPITNRSSHGRTTRGSSMTVEVFYPGESDPSGEALEDFAKSLLVALEPVLPEDRAEYFVP